MFKASKDGVSMTRGDLREVIASGSNRHIKLLASGKLRADSHPRSAQEMACKWNKLVKVKFWTFSLKWVYFGEDRELAGAFMVYIF